MSNTPHDALIKAILGQPEHAVAALRSIVPAALRDALVWSELRQEQASFTRVDGGTRHSDLLFAVPLREVDADAPPGSPRREALLYLLLEHQSTPDPLMAVRLLVYVARLFEERVLRAGAQRAPVVIPIVLAHGERPWSEAMTLDTLYDGPKALLDALGPLVPRLSYLLEDLTTLSDDAIASKLGSAVIRTTWTVLRDARTTEDLFDYAKRLLVLLAAARRQDRSAFASLFEYLLRTKDANANTARKVAAMMPPETQEYIVTAYESLIAEGVLQGKATAGRSTLAKLLRLKFGELGDEQLSRIEAADAATVDLWTERVLFAATVDDVFRG